MPRMPPFGPAPTAAPRMPPIVVWLTIALACTATFALSVFAWSAVMAPDGEAGVDARGPLGDERVDEPLRVNLLLLGDLRERQPLLAQRHHLGVGQAEDRGDGAGRLDGSRRGAGCGRRHGGVSEAAWQPRLRPPRGGG